MSILNALAKVMLLLSLVAPGLASAGTDPVAPDPNTGANFNRYAYANNNPYRFTDPDGREAADRAYGAAVGYMFRNDPEKLRVWAGGEAAATTEGSLAEQGAVQGQAIGEFVDRGDYSAGAAAAAAFKAIVLAKTYKSGANFTRAQKRDILQANRDRNGGELRSDKSGELLQPAQQSKKGVTPPQNEAHVDHKTPRAAGGTNDPQNAQVLSRKENLKKSDKIE